MLNGTPIKFGSALPATVGAIIEHPGFLPFDSGFHNLLLLANIRHTITREKIRATMLRVGLDPDSKKPVRAYSLGMCQRLGIAQAIMEDPEILILDEPFNSLDQGGVSEIRRLILELKQGGTTILLASHNPEDIDTLCDSVYCVEKGTLSAIK
jgi:ABC-2 type transport system ATP-binding protein